MGLFAYIYIRTSIVEMYNCTQLAHLTGVRPAYGSIITARLEPLDLTQLTQLSLVTTTSTLAHTMTNRLLIPVLITGMILTVRSITYSS